MDRKGQLTNVSFGGAWSEVIADEEALADAVALLADAALQAGERDPRRSRAVVAALDLAASCHPKGPAMLAAWARACTLPPGLREA
ncbi:MAG: hypothetical protein DI637_13945 [Citromicrobium sp.]|nr:MAG: hypothetical protein DI637_13945 [Citromicrobium sp.]